VSKLTVIVDKVTGAVSLLHDDMLLQRIGTVPVKVDRLSNIEFDNDAKVWNTCSERTGAVLYRHPSREQCLAWEKDHVRDLLAEHRKAPVCS
jgi:hypothetical protein